mmetsp:Transcript_40755/g.130050  ORF Transcript_40755/g.130050 Transcript_40755/m.130050 type:complete len:292 (+) Transcript_40755:2733-3608(+)
MTTPDPTTVYAHRKESGRSRSCHIFRKVEMATSSSIAVTAARDALMSPPVGGVLIGTTTRPELAPLLSSAESTNVYDMPGSMLSRRTMRVALALPSASAAHPSILQTSMTRDGSMGRPPTSTAHVKTSEKALREAMEPVSTSFSPAFHRGVASGGTVTTGGSPPCTESVCCATASRPPLTTVTVNKYSSPDPGDPSPFPCSCTATDDSPVPPEGRAMASPPGPRHVSPAAAPSASAQLVHVHDHANSSDPGSPSGSFEAAADTEIGVSPAAVGAAREATRGDATTSNDAAT